MRIIETKTYEEMSRLAAGIIGAQVLLKPKCVLGLATGSSPIGAYDILSENCQNGLLDFSSVKTVNLDEYCGLTPDHPQSYRYFMDTHLFDRINIKKENTCLPHGDAEDLDAECARYEELVDSLGGVDLQLLGLGHNGHIGFNEPEAYFPRYVHPVELSESTRRANSRLFNSIEEVPTHAITMGVGTILKAEKILLIAGADKRDIIKKALYGNITPAVPASALQLHRDVTVIVVAG